MELDIDKIKKLSKKKENENFRFRAFLKSGEIPEDQLDQIVNTLYHQVSSEIDCTMCANCCRNMQPGLDQEDMERFSECLGIPIGRFKQGFLVEGEEPNLLYIKEVPCPFLKDNRCTYYDCRPKECRDFPHLHKPGFTQRTHDIIINYSICPIVLNVLERLKGEVWFE